MLRNEKHWLRITIILAALALLIALPAVSGADGHLGITSPEDGATVSGSVDVMGVVTDPNFEKWQLDILPGGEAAAAIHIATGEEQVPEEDTLATIDTTMYPDGTHSLRLRIVRTNGQYDEYINEITIANGDEPPAAAPAPEESEEPAMADDEAAMADDEAAMADDEAAMADDEAAMADDEAATDEPAAPASGNGIVSPEDAASISGSVEVTGVATDPNFEKWQLDILAGGEESAAIHVANGEEQLTEAGTMATVDTTMYPDGDHAFRLRVVHNDGQYDEYFSDFTIANGDAPAAAAAPDADEAEAEVDEEAAAEEPADEAAAPASANGIVSPEDGASISGSAEVTGVATDANFDKWQLDILPASNAADAIFVALGEELVPEEDTLATVDTTMYPDGTHSFRLRVVRNDGQYDEYFSEFTIANGDAPAAAAAPEVAAMADDEAAMADDEAAMADDEAAMADDEAAMADDEAAADEEETAAADEDAAPESGNGFVSPEEGATVSGSVEVVAVAADPNFDKWQLDILPDGEAAAAIHVANGEEPASEEDALATIDTTMYPDGTHTLRLRVVRNDGQYDEYFVEFTIANS